MLLNKSRASYQLIYGEPENPENQNYEIVADTSKLVLEWNCSFQFASYKWCYHKVYQSILIFNIWYQYDIENWHHYNMKFYTAPRYCYNIIMMLDKDII